MDLPRLRRQDRPLRPRPRLLRLLKNPRRLQVERVNLPTTALPLRKMKNRDAVIHPCPTTTLTMAIMNTTYLDP